MRRFFLILFLILTITIHFAFGQEFLPNISIISHNGKVVVSWQNNYKKTISNILIQRSYDSLKNFSTIGTVLNPLNKENGYMDANPPYKRMYYRVLISFDGGAYEIGKSVRPDMEEIELDEVAKGTDIVDKKEKMARLSNTGKGKPLHNVAKGLKAFLKGRKEPMEAVNVEGEVLDETSHAARDAHIEKHEVKIKKFICIFI